jgi:hypothetical protein
MEGEREVCEEKWLRDVKGQEVDALYDMWVFPHHPPGGEEGLGDGLGSEWCDWSRVICGAWVGGATSMLEHCGVGCQQCHVVLLGPCGGGPRCQEDGGEGGWLLAFWCLGSRSWSCTG